MNFDWAELAFGSKKPLRELRATLIAAPREISRARFTQLVKEYLPKGNIILGLAKEKFIGGFENQPQFQTFQHEVVREVIEKVNASSSPHKIYTLHYFQRELPFVIEKLGCKQALFINGSWKYLFHSRPVFYTLVKNDIPYELVSPFSSEAEAQEYAARFDQATPLPKENLNEAEMFTLAEKAASLSFDYGFQTGVALGQKVGKKYKAVAATFNEVVPYQTYAMHFGAVRETNFSPMHDLNHYDTIHAEVALIIKAQKERIDLHGTTLFINLLPCPTCARMFMQTDIAEFVYKEDHSQGYALKMLERAGKKVRRLLP